MLQSDGTVKLSSTPDRLKNIEVKKVKKRLQAKGPVSRQEEEEGDEDAALFGLGPKKPVESFMDFLRTTGPEDAPSITGRPVVKSTSDGLDNMSTILIEEDEEFSKKNRAKVGSSRSFKDLASLTGHKSQNGSSSKLNTEDDELGAKTKKTAQKSTPVVVAKQKLNLQPRDAKPAIEDEDDEDAELFGRKKAKPQESLADFLRDSEPPPQPAVVPPPPPVKKSGFSKLMNMVKSSTSTNSLAASESRNVSHNHLEAIPPSAVMKKKSISGSGEDISRRSSQNSVYESSVGGTRKSLHQELPPVPAIPKDHLQMKKNGSVQEVNVTLPKKVPVMPIIDKIDESSTFNQVMHGLSKVDVKFLHVFQAKIQVVLPENELSDVNLPERSSSRAHSAAHSTDVISHAIAITLAQVGIQTEEIDLKTQNIQATADVDTIAIQTANVHQNAKSQTIENSNLEQPSQTISIHSEEVRDKVLHIDDISQIVDSIVSHTLGSIEILESPEIIVSVDSIGRSNTPAPIVSEPMETLEPIVTEPIEHQTTEITVLDVDDSLSEATTTEKNDGCAKCLENDVSAFVGDIFNKIIKKATETITLQSAQTQTLEIQTLESNTMTEPNQTDLLCSDLRKDVVDLEAEVAMLRELFNVERKKRIKLYTERETLRYRYEQLARVSFGFISTGLLEKYDLEMDIYNGG